MKSNSDIYRRAVAEVLQIPVEAVTDKQRMAAKCVCFNNMYYTAFPHGFDIDAFEHYALTTKPDEVMFAEVCAVLRHVWKRV